MKFDRLVVSKSKSNTNEAGILYVDGMINVIFPYGYRISENSFEIKRSIIDLIKCFEKFNLRRSNQKSVKFETENLGKLGKQKEFPFTSAIWLINDYVAKGISYDRNKNTTLMKSSLGVDWNKTIKNLIPVLNRDSYVYNSYYIKNYRMYSSIISDVQKFAVSRSLEILGWLFPGINFQGSYFLPYQKETCIRMLKKELAIRNNDKDKYLIKNLISFLVEDNGDKDINSIFKNFYTNEFEYIWEDLVYYSFNNVHIPDFYPRAKWIIDGNEILSSSLRPDTILLHDACFYILDAKYYKYGFTKKNNDLPKSSDIIKQIAYSDFLMENFDKEFNSIFVLPASYESNFFEIFGNAFFVNKYKKKVIGVCADLNLMISVYLNKVSIDPKREFSKLLTYNVSKNF